MTNANIVKAGNLAKPMSVAVMGVLAEDRDASRQLALLQAVSMMLNRAEAERTNGAPLVTWTCALLEMLEDGMSAAVDPQAEPQDVQEVYKAISRVQEALGVPEYARAWVPEENGAGTVSTPAGAPSAAPAADTQAAGGNLPLEDARPFALQALCLFPLLQPLLDEALARDPGALLRCRAVLVGAAQALAQAGSAATVQEYQTSSKAARSLLGAAMQYAETVEVDQVWGLFTGVTASLADGDRHADGSHYARR